MHLIARRKCAFAIFRPRVGRQRQRGDMMWTAVFARPDLPDEGIPILVRQPDIRDDPGIYPPESVRRLLYIDRPAPRAYERARTRAWSRMKSGC